MEVPSGTVTECPSISAVTVRTAVDGSCTAVISTPNRLLRTEQKVVAPRRPRAILRPQQQCCFRRRGGPAVGVQAPLGVVAGHHLAQAVGVQRGDAAGPQL